MHPAVQNFIDRPLWQKVAFWGGSLLFLSYCCWQFIVQSTYEELAGLDEKIESLQVSITEERRVARDLSRFRKEVKDLEIKLNFALQELPDKREIPDLLSTISSLARDTGLTVNLFKPMPENYREFYAEVPVSIAVEGTYHQIASFFDEVGHLPRIVNINQIVVKEPKVGASQVTVKAECVATTFRYLDESERTQAAATPEEGRRHRK